MYPSLTSDEQSCTRSKPRWACKKQCSSNIVAQCEQQLESDVTDFAREFDSVMVGEALVFLDEHLNGNKADQPFLQTRRLLNSRY